MSRRDSAKIKIKNKNNGLSITIKCNLLITDVLNVTFDLKSATYAEKTKQWATVYNWTTVYK